MHESPIWLLCTGLGHASRGFETHIRMLGNCLAKEPQLNHRVIIYGGAKAGNDQHSHANWCIKRNSWLATRISRDPVVRYRIEQYSFFLSLIPKLLRKKPAVIYLAEYQLYCHLFRLRKWLKLSYRLVHYTGGMALPTMFDAARDRVHHVSPKMMRAARQLKIPDHNQMLVPHFFEPAFRYDDALTTGLRALSGGKLIALSVAAVNASFKRVDQLVLAMGAFPDDLFPVIIGEFSEETPAIAALLEEKFGKEFILREVKEQAEMGSYYAAADLFVHCSDEESFGLVFLEALWHGLPVLAHHDEVTEFVMQDQADLVDTRSPATLQASLAKMMQEKRQDSSVSLARHRFVQERFSWKALSGAYLSLFH